MNDVTTGSAPVVSIGMSSVPISMYQDRFAEGTANPPTLEAHYRLPPRYWDHLVDPFELRRQANVRMTLA